MILERYLEKRWERSLRSYVKANLTVGQIEGLYRSFLALYELEWGGTK